MYKQIHKQTLATKTEASMMALICLSQPLDSNPLRYADMEFVLVSNTGWFCGEDEWRQKRRVIFIHNINVY